MKSPITAINCTVQSFSVKKFKSKYTLQDLYSFLPLTQAHIDMYENIKEYTKELEILYRIYNAMETSPNYVSGMEDGTLERIKTLKALMSSTKRGLYDEILALYAKFI